MNSDPGQLQIFTAGIMLGVAIGAASTAIVLEVIVPALRSFFTTSPPHHHIEDPPPVGYETQPPRRL